MSNSQSITSSAILQARLLLSIKIKRTSPFLKTSNPHLPTLHNHPLPQFLPHAAPFSQPHTPNQEPPSLFLQALPPPQTIKINATASFRIIQRRDRFLHPDSTINVRMRQERISSSLTKASFARLILCC